MSTKTAIRRKTVQQEFSFNPYQRVIISSVSPSVDCGYFSVKGFIGDRFCVAADVFAEGHDEVAGCLEYRHETEEKWHQVPLIFIDNDRWENGFILEKLGIYFYTIKAWVDDFTTWLVQFKKREDRKDIAIDLIIGLNMIKMAKKSAHHHDDKQTLDFFINSIEKQKRIGKIFSLIQDGQLLELMSRYGHRTHTAHSQTLKVIVDRQKARFSTWYEIFPRSCFGEQKNHSNFQNMIHKLHYIKNMGFDVVYLPPIHPIGLTNRKGKNNSLEAKYDDPGSPWAIGNGSGGHMAVHPDLGSLQDFKKLVSKANELGMEIALDFALQCSPDHPFLKEHNEWFKIRPDGSLQYAENPPKKYQDIYPLNFETAEWYSLWKECKKIFLFWIKHGVKIFRVDNPHTKPFIFWQWLISEIRSRYPDVIFLAEAFTRPKIMYHLAKIGFTQSYTYFTWRNSKAELTDYFEELTRPPICEFFRPNLWPNTPDILHEYLQVGKEPAFIIRVILAATLGSSYGIYGPAYELCVNAPLKKGSEEYLNSEKYEVKHWEFPIKTKVHDIIKKINQIRKENPALQSMLNLKFHETDNPKIICYSKHTDSFANVILVIVNLDYEYTQSGWVNIATEELGIADDSYCVKDLISGTEYVWKGMRNYVELDPHHMPAHVFEVLKSSVTECEG